ncbi:MAG TPA: GyrI-like domain-containing protein [Bryobacteraceae bacterium]|nr:GyrI-like domain-containing protein [Bryobacteraceae bacterium]
MLPATQIEFTEADVASTLAVQVHGQSNPAPASIGAAIETAFATLDELRSRHALRFAGPPRVIYNSYGAEGVSFTLAMPVAPLPAPVEDPALEVKTLPAAHTYRFTHHGPYREVMRTYGEITAFMKAQGLMRSDADWARYMPMWEEYLNDPKTTPESELVTHIYLPVWRG